MVTLNFVSVRLSSVFIVLLWGLQFSFHTKADELGFCPRTLARPTCPDLPTYDAFDVLTYGGRWYEIGSSANFKNLQESGGICVLANYTLLEAPKSGKGGVIGVNNTLYSIGADNHNGSQVFISISTGDICSNAYTVCAEVDGTDSPLVTGVGVISNISLDIALKYPALALSLAGAAVKLEVSINKIKIDLDILSNLMTEIQIKNADIGQGILNTTTNVELLLKTASNANASIVAIAKEVQNIAEYRSEVEKVAAKLPITDGNKLAASSNAIAAAENAILNQTTEMQESLAYVVSSSSAFLAPNVGPVGYGNGITGSGVQNASFAGKLIVSFPGFPSGNYWVLAVENATNYDGYAASLVYGCDQTDGGIVETLFVLSRTPSLPGTAVDRLLGKAAELGVAQDCSNPFIFTVQDPERCGNPPGFVTPY